MMTKRKSTKRALLSSVVALLLCFSMLLGSTFAWFTDSAQSGINTIQSGNLDIELEYSTYDADAGKWTDYVTVPSDKAIIGEDALYEPGYTEVVKLKVINKGNLAAKYQLGMDIYDEVESTSVEGTSLKLSDYIKVGAGSPDAIKDRESAIAVATKKITEATMLNYVQTPFGEVPANWLTPNGELSENDYSSEWVFVLHMPETVGNEANYDKANGAAVPTITLGVKLLATQATYESDSFDDQYDKEAQLQDVTFVSNSTELAAALKKGGLIKFANNIEVDNGDSTASAFIIPSGKEATLDLNGMTLSTGDDFCGVALFENKHGAKLTITGNGTVEMKPKKGKNPVMFAPRGELIIENGTFKIPFIRGNDDNPEGNGQVAQLFAGINVGNSGKSSNVVVYDGYFDGGYWRTDEKVSYDTYGLAGPCTLINLSWNETFTVYGGTFVGYNPVWGDEACAKYYETCDEVVVSKNRSQRQGTFLKGQKIDDTELPEGYTITEGTTSDGTNRPTYTVSYSN